MTLAEKIMTLRGERKLSQGDLAEKLDVSRQSVSKWETGQAVPELDKIVKLADLFGVTVDELVRDGEAPRPEAPPAAEPETKIVYVQRRYTTVQTLGIILIAGGLVMILSAVFVGGDPLAFIGGFLAIVGLPLLLVKKHPLLSSAWIVWAIAYPLLCTPLLMGRYCRWQPFTAVVDWCPLAVEDYSPVTWLLWLAFLGESVLTVLLPIVTGWLCLRRWKGRKALQEEPGT